MLINMWSTGELKREFKVHKAKVYMRITRPLETTAEPVVIELNNASFYYPQTTQELWDYMPVFTEQCARLRLPEELKTVQRFLDYVQDGFDEMFKTFPEENDREKQVYGEMTTKFGDLTLTKEVSR